MTGNDPFAVLLEIANLSVSTAEGLPAQEDLAGYWSGIGFKIAGKKVVAPMGEITEMLEVPAGTRVPGVKPWITGVANVRGRLLPLFDMEAFFGLRSAFEKTRSQRVLTMEIGDLYSGLIVEEVYGMKHFSEDTFQEQLPEGSEALQAFSSGCFTSEEDDTWLIFSPMSLAGDARFFNAAQAG